MKLSSAHKCADISLQGEVSGTPKVNQLNLVVDWINQDDVFRLEEVFGGGRREAKYGGGVGLGIRRRKDMG